jgi:hypothetical protein
LMCRMLPRNFHAPASWSARMLVRSDPSQTPSHDTRQLNTPSETPAVLASSPSSACGRPVPHTSLFRSFASWLSWWSGRFVSSYHCERPASSRSQWQLGPLKIYMYLETESLISLSKLV